MSDQEIEQPLQPHTENDFVMLKTGDSVTGKIVKIDEDVVFVDVGYKMDGLLPISELAAIYPIAEERTAKIGDELTLKVLRVDEQHEKLLLTKHVVALDESIVWDQLQSYLTEHETISAPVVEVVKGGLVVDVGVRGFVPASMVERTFVEDFSDYIGRTLRLRVKELDREKNKVILSQREILDEEFGETKKKWMRQIKVGQIFDGTVSRLSPFGAFVDIGGVDGLVHISEMAWQHISDPAELVKVGDTCKVQVLQIDLDKEKIGLSMKSLQEGPWVHIEKNVHVGDIISGKVTRLTTFGAFVEIGQGLEGLVHISQITDRRIGHPSEAIKSGQTVTVKVLDIDANAKRISLSIKEAQQDSGKYDSTSKSRGDASMPVLDNQNVSVSNEAMMSSLAERLGDKLKHFK